MDKVLKKIFNEDQTDRQNQKLAQSTSDLMKKVNKKDTERRGKVKELINKNILKDAADFYHAAMIYQHGKTSDDYKKANELAKKGIKMGEDEGGLYYESCKWIYAASLDRYLLSVGQKQKYGTQFQKNKQGEWELSPYDPNTTDEERDKYHVSPVGKALKILKQDMK